MEGELQSLNEQLEEKVEERTGELRAAQDTLVRTEKLSSLGKLSASIAHEINNPLAGILTFAKLMIRTIEHGPVGRGRAEDAGEAAGARPAGDRALLGHRPEPARLRARAAAPAEGRGREPGRGGGLLAGRRTRRPSWGSRSTKDLARVPMVEADFGQLRQAFVNIVINAIEAMGKGGHLSRRHPARCPRRTAVEIVFQDDGPGIPPELMQKIFDPFFTTKEKGTGLGLSVVYGIVERHKGRVDGGERAGQGDPLHHPAARAARGS